MSYLYLGNKFNAKIDSIKKQRGKKILSRGVRLTRESMYDFVFIYLIPNKELKDQF